MLYTFVLISIPGLERGTVGVKHVAQSAQCPKQGLELVC